MSLQERIMSDLKDAMRSKDKIALEAIRAIKAAILLAVTESSAKVELNSEEEIKLLQRLVKQRKDSAELYKSQNRLDLAEPELQQVAVIEKYLPQQLSKEELKFELGMIISALGASSPADMGKVMGIASKKLAGRAEGRAISEMVKEILGSK